MPKATMFSPPTIRQVATLADSRTATTCSAIVARRLHFFILCCGCFEDAVALVKAGVADAALVPGAYPKIGPFFMDPTIRLLRAFASDIPALVLAAKPTAAFPFRRVFAHSATQPFWPELACPVSEALSNDAAAAAVKSKNVACITNSAAAKRAGLKVIRVLREASPMSWNLFVRVDITVPTSMPMKGYAHSSR